MTEPDPRTDLAGYLGLTDEGAAWCHKAPVGTDAARDRAAAVQLRQLDRIEAALGPVSNIRRVGAQLPDCTSYSLASLGQWLTGIADALEADDGA